MSFLTASAMTGGYGKADILHSCNLSVEKGQIAVIVGPNGAGKSTAMKAVFGMLPLRDGKITLDGTDITALSPQQRVSKGMGFVPQVNNVFPTMTVEENLEIHWLAIISSTVLARTLPRVISAWVSISLNSRAYCFCSSMQAPKASQPGSVAIPAVAVR